MIEFFLQNSCSSLEVLIGTLLEEFETVVRLTDEFEYRGKVIVLILKILTEYWEKIFYQDFEYQDFDKRIKRKIFRANLPSKLYNFFDCEFEEKNWVCPYGETWVFDNRREI